jgi:16S rRNA (guanine966-N2)-methyltransferase
MSVKILGGVARGFSLATPNISSTRPTSVMLKRKLFDSIQNFSSCVFVDLCAGSGSIGLEASSRGAEETILIESNPKTVQVLKKNCKDISEKYNLGSIKVHKKEFSTWLKANTVMLSSLSNVYIFFDPPYEIISLYEQFFDQIKNFNAGTMVIVEACQQKTMKIPDFEQKFGIPKKIFKQGTSYFAIFEIQ